MQQMCLFIIREDPAVILVVGEEVLKAVRELVGFSGTDHSLILLIILGEKVLAMASSQHAGAEANPYGILQNCIFLFFRLKAVYDLDSGSRTRCQ